jgi:hypothetical protein
VEKVSDEKMTGRERRLEVPKRRKQNWRENEWGF